MQDKRNLEKREESNQMKQNCPNKRLLSLLSILLILSMLLGMTACSKDGGNSNTSNDVAKNAVFREKDLSLSLDHQISYIDRITKLGERIYGIATSNEEYISTTWLISMALDGTDVQYSVLQTVDNSAYYDEGLDPYMYGEDVAAIAAATMEEVEEESGETVDVDETEATSGTEAEDEDAQSEETAAPDDGSDNPGEDGVSGETAVPAEGPDDIADETYSYTYTYYIQLTADQSCLYLIEDYYGSGNDGSYFEKYSLICLDTDGNQLWTVPLGENGADVMSYFYVNSLLGLKDGVALVSNTDNSTVLTIYDSQGNQIRSTPLEVDYLDTLIATPDGGILIKYTSETDYTEWLAAYDMETGTIGEPFQIPDVSRWNYTLMSYVYGGTYDLYYISSQSLYGYRIGEEASVELMNYIDSDIDSSSIQNLVILDDENMLALSYDYSANDYQGACNLFSLTKVPPEEVEDRIILQLATYGNMYTLRSQVLDFNKANDTYRIKITDYSTYNSYDTDGGWYAGLTQLSNDIMYGNAPDIICLNTSMPVNSYINKGVLADLYPLIDEDPDLNRDDFLSNVLEAFTVDGKLYQIIPSFDIMTVAAKSSLVGETPGWTVQDMVAVASANPDAQIFDDTTASGFLNVIINYSGDEWINWEEGTCSFDSESFIALLEFSNTLPKDYSVYEELWNSEDYWMSYDSRFREDKTLLNNLYLYNIRTYQRTKYATFGEDITLIGYPMTSGNGAILSYDTSYAISSSCQHPEGAWSFIRQYLLEDYQSTITNSWPVTLQQMDVLREEAKEKPYYLDADGNKIEYEDTYWVNDQEITIPTATDEEIDRVMEIVTGTTTTYHYDEDLMTIISEEVEAFYSGQKTAASVAEIIQSRANIYISENY